MEETAKSRLEGECFAANEEIELEMKRKVIQASDLVDIEEDIRYALGNIPDFDHAAHMQYSRRDAMAFYRIPKELFKKDPEKALEDLTSIYSKIFDRWHEYGNEAKNLHRQLTAREYAEYEKIRQEWSHADPEKMLNCLRIMCTAYKNVFYKLAKYASWMAQHAIRVYGAGTDQGNMIIETTSFDAIESTLNDMHDLIVKSDRIFLERRHNDTASLKGVMRESEEIARLCYEKPKIELKIKPLESDIDIYGNEHDLTRALLNILLDKIHVLREVRDGMVDVDFDERVSGDSTLLISVKDNGNSLPYEDTDTVFNKARQEASERKFNIYESRRIVEQNNGQLMVENMQSKGVEFKMFLSILRA